MENSSPSAISDSDGHINAERTEMSPLYSGGHSDTRGLRIIVSCLSVLSVIVSVALAAQLHYGDYQVVPHGSVVTDSRECSLVGVSILKKGGNAVDAAIASALCLGVVQPHLTGIGGGGFMLIYDHRAGQVLECIDFRPTRSVDPRVGVPGFLPGLATAFRAFAKLTWDDLFAPALHIARSGFRASNSLVISARLLDPNIANKALSAFLLPLQPGQIVTIPSLADTLASVATAGPDGTAAPLLLSGGGLYIVHIYNNPTLARRCGMYCFKKRRYLITSLMEFSWDIDLCPNVRDQITYYKTLAVLYNDSSYFSLPADDIAGYTALRGGCLHGRHGNYELYTTGRGSGGPLLLDVLTRLGDSQLTSLPALALLFRGNDASRWPISSGTQLAVMDRNDLYVSLVSGLGSVLGAQVLAPGGFILNNAVSIAPLGLDNRPVSLALPLIAASSNQICGHRFILGGSDVRDVTQLLVPLLEKGVELGVTVEGPRVRISAVAILPETHHVPSLTPQEQEMLQQDNFSLSPAPLPYPSINVVCKLGDLETAYADSRGGGEAITF